MIAESLCEDEATAKGGKATEVWENGKYMAMLLVLSTLRPMLDFSLKFDMRSKRLSMAIQILSEKGYAKRNTEDKIQVYFCILDGGTKAREPGGPEEGAV